MTKVFVLYDGNNRVHGVFDDDKKLKVAMSGVRGAVIEPVELNNPDDPHLH